MKSFYVLTDDYRKEILEFSYLLYCCREKRQHQWALDLLDFNLYYIDYPERVKAGMVSGLSVIPTFAITPEIFRCVFCDQFILSFEDYRTLPALSKLGGPEAVRSLFESCGFEYRGDYHARSRK